MVRSVFIITLIILALFSSCNSGKESEASAFLRENNRNYCYTETALVGSGGNRIPFSPYQYSTLYGALDTLETLKVFNTVYSKQYPDSTVVSDAFIREHAARRVKQWKESPYYRNLSWEEFREYWLPYRIETEKFCDYHAALDEKHGYITNALKQGMSVAEATNLLQDDLRKRLVFDLRDHASLNQPSVLETMELGKGGCRGITTLTTLALRNIGIVSAIDECPVWAHRNSGHQWNVVLTENGEWIPFNGAEDSIGAVFPTLNDSVKAPKIYRKQFSRNPDFAPPVSREQTPALFLNDCRRDVTSAYQPTVDVTVTPTIEHEDSVLYLAVFNAEVWKIVSWAELKDGKATFKDMGCNDIVYLPVYYYRRTTLPAGRPFILHKDGSRTELQADTTRLLDRQLTYSNRFYDIQWLKSQSSPGRVLELYYWDGYWKPCDTYTTLKGRPLSFRNVPESALYLIKGVDFDNTWQRIFTLDGNEQRWY